MKRIRVFLGVACVLVWATASYAQEVPKPDSLAAKPDSLAAKPDSLAAKPAAQPPKPAPPATKPAPQATPPPAPETTEQLDITGRGSIGASGGGMLFLSGQDFGDQGMGKTRLIGHAIFKYNFTSSLAGVAETGWGWNTYTAGSQDTIAVIVPTTLGVEYRRRAGQHFLPHGALGAGLYWIGIKDTPNSYASAGDDAKKLKWTSPGIYGKIGTEYLWNSGISVNLDFLYHHVFSKNEAFAYTGLNPQNPLNNSWGLQNTSFGELRFGINYYFAFTHKESAPEPPPEGKK